MSQKTDREEYKKAWRLNQIRMAKERYDKCFNEYKESPTYKRVHSVLKEAGIKEPYASNMVDRLFDESYRIIINSIEQ